MAAKTPMAIPQPDVASFAAIVALSVAVGYIRRVATHYTISDRRLHIRRGILSRTEQYATLDRVQNVETQQSLLERMLRIGTVDFDTAGTDSARIAAKTPIAMPQPDVASFAIAPPPAARTSPLR